MGEIPGVFVSRSPRRICRRRTLSRFLLAHFDAKTGWSTKFYPTKVKPLTRGLGLDKKRKLLYTLVAGGGEREGCARIREFLSLAGGVSAASGPLCFLLAEHAL